MKLKQLIKEIPSIKVKGSKDINITGLSVNSKIVAPGNLFIAKKGKSEDGAKYIPEAIAAGANAILTDLYDPSLKNVVQVIHQNVGEVEGLLAAQYYQNPANDLFMVGITGTNGKTTTAFIVKYLLDQFFGPCGLIGTIEYILGSIRYQATRTTPDVISNYKMLREMITQGCRSAVMEVTSHALDQGRVAHIDFDAAIFSNLTLDHLDYHQTMENYCDAKNNLFRKLGTIPSKKKNPKIAIVNTDSPWTTKIIEGCKTKKITYGIENNADLRASNVRLGKHGTELDLIYQGKTYPCQWPLIGRFNVYNCLSAMAVVISRGLPLEEIVEKMRGFPGVRGRLQLVSNDLNLKIVVDYAHSDDALMNILETLTELKTGKIITVFGCGGDRDRSKRPKMGSVCQQYSDYSIVTSDNPRTEDPKAICDAILQGYKSKESVLVEIDRYKAIEKAIGMATENDIILIAGKGHETYQIFSHKTIEFDDCKVANEICAKLALIKCEKS
ncbi:MAG: UDP-N-acetylmuramoyl-L-alanyl-D-glutamate--2,6-diaminopimelate ligase [Parachlamydiaceae bacterium]|nr:UDP-N-acetylmuramoyl-L-alanyl-D-glutamate--2,6-diaminopimelate ligase [Parachlamydiaceae bacterium]